MTVHHRRSVVGVLLTLQLASTRVVGADTLPVAENQVAPKASAETNKSDALQSFKRGLELFKAHDYEAALAEFLKSEQTYSTQVALRNAALCLEQLERYDEALARYDELLQKHGGQLPQNVAEEVAEAQKRLLPFVGTLRLTVNVDGAQVSFGDRELGDSPLPAPIYGMPGTHRLRVSKPGYEPHTSALLLSAGQEQAVPIQLDAQAPTPPPPTPVPVAAVSEPPPDSRPPSDVGEEPTSPGVLPWVVLGTGAAVLGFGTIMYVDARNKAERLEEQCPEGKCSPETPEEHDAFVDERSEYRQARTLAYVGFGVGLVGVGAGVTLLVAPDLFGSEQASVGVWSNGTLAGVRGSF